jgi:hypothetical protein
MAEKMKFVDELHYNKHKRNLKTIIDDAEENFEDDVDGNLANYVDAGEEKAFLESYSETILDRIGGSDDEKVKEYIAERAKNYWDSKL